MLTFQKFTGVNRVVPAHRLKENELTEAMNVDIGLTGELKRRAGYVQASSVCHKNVWEADGFKLATVNSDLVVTTGATQTVIYPSLGSARVWYCNLPDGRTTFSNGNIHGITDGVTTTDWGVPIPASIGALADVTGGLTPGDYQYQLTHVRLSDKQEGPPVFSNPLPISAGGVVLTGLPQLAGHKLNVYLTAANAGTGYLAGSTSSAAFSFTGTNTDLMMPCRTTWLDPFPVGTVTAFWRGRALVADGRLLWASIPNSWELCDRRRDYKQFSAPITLIQPVDGGIFVGTTEELAFLKGNDFDDLIYAPVVNAPTALGSGVEVRGELILRNGAPAEGRAMICIADGAIVAGFSDGNISRLSEGRYKTAATEVAATFRMADRIPQYVAIPQ